MKIKQSIQIGTNVTAIMQLPCVFSCHKDSDGRLCYLLYAWDNYGYKQAHQGDWLCEDEQGEWHVYKTNPLAEEDKQ